MLDATLSIYVSLTDEELARPDVFEEAFAVVAIANGATEVVARRASGAIVFSVDRCDLLPSVLPDIASKMFRRMMAAATTAEGSDEHCT